MTTASSLGGVGVLGAAPVGQAVTGSQVVADAAQYIGVPYQWGGTSPATGFDCSGLVQHVYADLGIALPRTSQEQATVGSPVASLADARPGDLLFFEPGPGGPGHVGIYIGNGKMIDAPHTGTTVQVQSVWTAPCAIRQIVPSSGPVGAPVSGTPVAAMVGASSPATVAGLGSLGVPATLAPLFLSAGATYGVSPQLLAAVAKVESGYDPTAVSSAGAQGLMQLMPSTASSLGVDPFDPAQAVDGAAQILAGNLKAFGSVPLALAAYNAGAGAVQSYGGIPPYPETQTYVSTIMGLLGGSSS
ncbi:MAG: NlpC/P60 family protein [Actinomycetota bacterium]|nr:NlpC/P60 family protein [Actinomycetota bacterium]MDA8293692.1 NlpC/P60 family protein [Actinomycetota bacterium]